MLVRHYIRRLDEGADGSEHGDDGYTNGIKATWREVHRILAKKYGVLCCAHGRTGADKSTVYLVKWTDLPYDQATWETADGACKLLILVPAVHMHYFVSFPCLWHIINCTYSLRHRLCRRGDCKV